MKVPYYCSTIIFANSLHTKVSDPDPDPFHSDPDLGIRKSMRIQGSIFKGGKARKFFFRNMRTKNLSFLPKVCVLFFKKVKKTYFEF